MNTINSAKTVLYLKFSTIFMAISAHTHIPHSLTNYTQQLYHKLHPTASPQTTPNSLTTNYSQQPHHKLHPTASPQTTPNSLTTNYSQQPRHILHPTASPQTTPNSLTTNYTQQPHHKLHPTASPQTSSFRLIHDRTDRKRQRGKQKCGPPVFTGIHRSSRLLQTHSLCCL